MGSNFNAVIAREELFLFQENFESSHYTEGSFCGICCNPREIYNTHKHLTQVTGNLPNNITHEQKQQCYAMALM